MSVPQPPHLDYWCELQCPDCHLALNDIRALRAKYGPALTIDLRHFPLEKHAYAFTAAQAAEEAWAQGQLWPFVEGVLERSDELGKLGEPVLYEVAEELGLDTSEVETSLIDGRHILAVDADHAEGQALGVTGTPSYVVDGVFLDGSRSQEGLRERVEELLDARF